MMNLKMKSRRLEANWTLRTACPAIMPVAALLYAVVCILRLLYAAPRFLPPTPLSLDMSFSRASFRTPRWEPPAASPEFCEWRNVSALGPDAAVFLHVWPANTWRPIADDIVAALQASPLLACGVRVHASFPTGASWPYDGIAGGFELAVPSARFNVSGRRFNEDATLSALVDWCAPRPRAVVMYLHDKGTRTPVEQAPSRFLFEWSWRKLHEYFLVVQPQGCFRALAAGWDTCGTNRRSEPALHYSGNFWAATCAYINTLPHPTDPALVERFGAFYFPEYWIGAANSATHRTRAFNCFSSRVNHYLEYFSHSLYSGAQCNADVAE